VECRDRNKQTPAWFWAMATGLVSVTLGGGKMDGAIASPTLTYSNLVDTCKIAAFKTIDQSPTNQTLNLSLSFISDQRVQITWEKSTTVTRTLERFRKDLEKTINHAENRSLVTSLKTVDPAERRKTLASWLLNAGYITSEVAPDDTLDGMTLRFKVIPGQLVEIHPWQVKTGELTLELQNNHVDIPSVDPLIRRVWAKGAADSVSQAAQIERVKLKLIDELKQEQAKKLERLRTSNPNEGFPDVFLDKKEVLDVLNSISSKLDPGVEFQFRQQEEQFGTVDLPSSITMTFELTLRQELAEAEQTFLCRRIRRGVGYPLSASRVEDQLRLLREDSTIDSIDGILKQSIGGECSSEKQSEQQDPTTQLTNQRKSQGKSCLDVKIVKSNRLAGGVNVDNYSPPSVGSARAGVDLQMRRVLGFGDEFGIAYSNSFTGGNQLIDLVYRAPINPMNGTVQLRTSQSFNRITQQDLVELDIKGRAEVYDFTYRQPLLRTPFQEVAVSLGFTAQNGQTFLFDRLPTPFGIGPNDQGISRTRVLKLGAEYLTRTPKSALALRGQLNIGTGLFGATTNDAPIPDGHFLSGLAQVQWLQRWRRDHLLVVQGEVQLTSDSLLPSQQFVIGGGQSIRGYQQNARSGDNGFRFSVENRIAFWNRSISGNIRDKQGYLPTELEANPKPDRGCAEPLHDLTWSIVPFAEVGAVWNQRDNPNTLPELVDNRLFASAGVGLLVEARPLTARSCSESLSFRVDFGYPLIRSKTRGTDLQDLGVYFSLRYRF
jgi:hemolysin activation/secretion protein